MKRIRPLGGNGGLARTIVIRDTPTDELLEIRGMWLEQLTWGLSAQARKQLEIKVGAVEYRLTERGVEFG